MNFEIRPPDALLVHDSQPGNHATVFGPDGKILGRRPEFDSFDDGRRTYTWGFAYGAVHEGDEFVFTTADRVVVGVCRGGAIGLTDKTVEFVRDPIGKPLFVKRPRIVPSPPRVTAPVTRVDSDEPLVKLVTLGGKTGMVANKTPAQQKPTNSMRCLFLNPSVPYGNWNCYRTGMMNEASFSAHGMAYVSAALKRDGHECWLLDMRSMESWAHLEQSIRAQDYDVVFVGFLSIDAFNAAGAVRLLKEVHPDKPVIVGGLHVSIAKERVFPRADLIEYYCWNNYDIVPTVFKEFLAWKGESKFDTKNFPLADFVILDDGEIAAQNLVSELSNGRWPSERTIEGGAVPMEIARHLDRDLFNLEIEAYSPILPFQPVPLITTTWARGCPFRCSYSVAGDTVIFTDDGPMKIEDLTAGIGAVKNCVHGAPMLEYRFNKTVATPSGRNVSTHALAEGVRPVMRVTTEGGFTIKATPEHHFLCAENDTTVWKRTDELKPDDFMVVRRPDRNWATEYQRLTPPNAKPFVMKRHRCPEILDEHLAWLTGYLIGDGCLSSDGEAVVRLCVPPSPCPLEQKLHAIVNEVFGTELHIYRNKHTDKQFQGQIHSRLAREVFVQSIGVGDIKHKLTIPSIFWRSPKTVLASFLEGLFDADAYDPGRKNGSEYLITVSEQLARDVAYAMLILDRGCPNVQYVEPTNHDSAERRPHYRVGTLLNDRIPSTRSVYKSKKSNLWHWRTKKSASRFGLRRRTLKESGLHHPLDRDGWFYVRVKSVVQGLSEPVYDITVPVEQAFIANGLVAHNCNLASQLSNSNVRTKPPELVEEELDQLYHRFAGNFGSIMIHDDLTFDSKHIAQWCELILRKYNGVSLWLQSRADWVIQRYRRQRDFWELLCRAGLTWVSVGYESGSQRMLDYMQKDNTVENNKECGRILDEYGINSFGNFLWGCPTETHEEAEETVKLVQEIRPGFLSGSIYCNFPGTQMDTKCRAEGLLEEGQVYARSHLPWQITVKGIDYAHRVDCITRAGQSANYLRMPKLVSEDIKRKLAASSRGLAIH